MQALDRAFEILELFTPADPEWTLTEIAAATGLPVTTSFRIVASLAANGYLERDPETRRYGLGPAAMALGRRSQITPGLLTNARAALDWLARATGQTALMTVVSEDRHGGTCIERVEGGHVVPLSSRPGVTGPLHAGASKKVLLAFLGEREQTAITSDSLERLCRGTITDRRRLQAHLARIRSAGWAASYEETDPGVWGLAAPVVAPTGTVVGAIGLAGSGDSRAAGMSAAAVTRVRHAATRLAGSIAV